MVVLGFLNSVFHIIGIILYGGGLRLLECLRLRVKDIDFKLNEIVVRDGKGKVDKRTVQKLPGHKDVGTTMIYTHELNRGGRTVIRPVD